MLQRVRYRRASELTALSNGLLVYMALAEQRGVDAQPEPARDLADLPHFRGRLARAPELRAALLGLREVVQARFHRPDLWRYIDPVVTAGDQRLRFECFSSCASAYGRVDLTPDAFEDAEMARFGTTNVDFSPKFAAAIAGIGASSTADLELGEDSVALAVDGAETVEKRVNLPDRWVRGFLQLQAIHRDMHPVAELDTAAARQLVAGLRAKPSGAGALHLGRRPRFVPGTTGGASDSVPLDGAHRLRLLKLVLPRARKVRIYRSPSTGATHFECQLPGGLFSLSLSARPSYGFSGDGEALRHMDPDALDAEPLESALATAEALNTFTLEEFERYHGGPARSARATVEALSAHGLLGYDVHLGRYFHRVLPFARQRVAQPARVRGAAALVDADAVELIEVTRGEGDPTRLDADAWVKSGDTTYRTVVGIADGYLATGSCTCAWYAEHGLERGPCKHMLATRIVTQREAHAG